MEKGEDFETYRKSGNRLYWRGKCYRITKGSPKTVYWSCLRIKCSAKIVENPIGTFKATFLEHTCDYDETKMVKEDGNKRLMEITLASKDGDKAIDIVRKFLNELTPEVLAILPNEGALVKRVRRYAKSGGITLGRSSFGDYLTEGGLDTSGASVKPVQGSSSHCSETFGGDSGNSSKYDIHEKNRLLIHKFQFMTLPTQTIKLVDDEGRSLGNVPLNRIATAGEDNSKFNLDYDKLPRVDELPISASTFQKETRDGEELATDLNDFSNNYQSDDAADDDDFPMDCDGRFEEAPAVQKTVKSRTVATSSKIENKKFGKRSARKGGEKCLVCGDDLLVSEASSSSQETFRRACCFLNVKSENGWFPRKSNGKFYSFCELCTNEIVKIHQLYKQVEQHQSLIFKKIELVEKQIADAEIVDSWLEDAPDSAVVRYEGFRKQVLINYRNKLKLRRQVRMGSKTGHHLTEIKPVTTAHMFASDPAETYAFRTIVNDTASHHEITSTEKPPVKRGRGRPRSKKTEEQPSDSDKKPFPILDNPVLNENSFDDNDAGDSGDFHAFENYTCDDDDAASVNSAREVKFWEIDPNKLHIDRDNSNDGSVSRNEENRDDSSDGVESSSDPDYVIDKDDDEDKDWYASKGRRNMKIKEKRKGKHSKKGAVSSKEKTKNDRRANNATKPTTTTTPKPEKPKPKAHVRNFEFPDVVLNRDGRLFMSGIEIIKNAPGAYVRCPQSISFTCSSCDKIMLSFHHMKTHICGYHLGMFNCPTCAKHFTQARSLERHISKIHSGKSTQSSCSICGKPISGGDSYMRYHLWSHLSEEEKKDPQYSSYVPIQKRDPNRIKVNHGCQTFMCTFCSKTFHQLTSLRNHELVHSAERPTFQCQFCGKSYKDKKNFRRHAQMCGKTPEEKAKEITYTYPCPQCPVRLKTRQIQALHIRRFHREPPALLFPCPKCPRRFSTRNGLKKHKLVCVEGQFKGAPKIGRRNRSQIQNTDCSQSSASNECHLTSKFETGIVPPMALEDQSMRIDSNHPSNGSAATKTTNAGSSSLYGGFGYMFGNYPGGSGFQSQ